jgi:hypothetical protein
MTKIYLGLLGLFVRLPAIRLAGVSAAPIAGPPLDVSSPRTREYHTKLRRYIQCKFNNFFLPRRLEGTKEIINNH